MEQIAFELVTPEPPSFANFVAGPNAEVLAKLRELAAGDARETALVLWGPPGSGRTHLLRATVAASLRPAAFVSDVNAVEACEGLEAALVAVDDVDRADGEAQARLFTLYNRLQEVGGQLVVAAASPPARLQLRDDLRSRLGWGLAYEVLSLPDADKPQALAHYARERGFRLGDDVIAYLLAHGRRDMPSLVATLGALDRRSLATKRPVTVPLLREWLAQPLQGL
jgi:DnaA family protein